jgi:hypothetical protein
VFWPAYPVSSDWSAAHWPYFGWQAIVLLQLSSSIIHRHASTHGGPGRVSSLPGGTWLYISGFIQ